MRKQREFYHKLGLEVPGDIKGETCSAKQHLDPHRNGEWLRLTCTSPCRFPTGVVGVSIPVELTGPGGAEERGPSPRAYMEGHGGCLQGPQSCLEVGYAGTTCARWASQGSSPNLPVFLRKGQLLFGFDGKLVVL